MMSMCRVFSCVIGRGCLLWPVHSLGKTLLAFALLHSVLHSQICLLLQVFLDFLHLRSHPLWGKGHFIFGVTSRSSLSHHRINSSSFFSIKGWKETWFTVIFCGLPWKQTEIILSFLKLHPSTAFCTRFLAVRATPFLLRDYCPQ